MQIYNIYSFGYREMITFGGEKDRFIDRTTSILSL